MTTLSNICSHLSSLVAAKSIFDQPKDVRQIFEYVQSILAGKDLQTKEYVFSDRLNLIVTSKNTKHPKILLCSHIDVVPGQDELFQITKKNDTLQGRGVFDMKFAAACYLQLIEDLADDLNKYDFGIMLTSDEEVGGENGVGALLELGYSADVCILPDGGDNWQIEESCNSVWIVKAISNGTTAHGSRPWEGENAITKLIDCLDLVSNNFSNKKGGNTLTLSQINGGCALNQVPDNAWATLDMRFKDEKSYSELRVKTEKIFIEAGLELETIAHVGATKLDKTNPLVKNFIDLATEQAPVEVGTTHSLGSSDAHYFESRGIPTILMRPRGGGAHSDHEWISESDLEIYYQLIKTYIEQNARTA